MSLCTPRPVFQFTPSPREWSFICSALGCRCPGIFSPQACLTCFITYWQLRYSKKEQPSKGDHQTLGLSECTWARTCWTGSIDWRRDEGEMTLWLHMRLPRVTYHTPSMCAMPSKNSRRNFCGTVQICESFLPWKFPDIRYPGQLGKTWKLHIDN